MLRQIAAVVLAGAIAPVFATPVSAQTATSTTSAKTIEIVRVTARRRLENGEAVPLKVDAYSGETLHNSGVTSALDLQTVSPTLTVAGDLGTRDTDVFTIRGQSQPFGGADPGVQTYFAEVPFNASSQGAFYDLDNVQVLAGPQGTLFGRNTTGGAILFEPKKPSDQFGGYLDGQFGNYNMREISGALNVPLAGDTLMMRVAGDFARRDGFTKDISTGSHLDNVNYDAFRVGLTWRPSDNFENYVVFDYFRDRNHGTGAELTGVNTATVDQLISQVTGVPCTDPTCGPIEAGWLFALGVQQSLGPRKTTTSIPLFYKRDSWGITDIARYDITSHLHVRNIFAYRSDKEQPAFDYDGSFLPILEIPNSRTWESNSYQLTEEFQLQGESDDNAVQWIAGYYHELDRPNGYSEVERQTAGGPGGPLGFGTTEFDSLSNGGTSDAVFGQASWNVIDKLTLTGGARYTWDTKVATSKSCIEPFVPVCPFPLTSAFANPTLKDNFRAPTWTLAANYQVSDDTMAYVTWRRGYKSGGFNSGAGAATDFAEFKPEYLTDVEAGVKTGWSLFGWPARTHIDAYYGWYQNVQKNDLIAVEQAFFGPPFFTVQPVALTFNAARATIKGVDFTSTFQPTDNLEVNVFYSYTDATYDKFVLPQAVFIDPFGGQTLIGALDHKGDPFAFTPRNKFGISPRLHIPLDSNVGDLYIGGTFTWQSKVWFTDLSDIETTCSAFIRPVVPGAPYTCLAPAGQAPEQKSYALINLRVDWNNVLGSSFDASAFVNNLTDKTYKVGANPLLHLTGTSASIYAPPRMWGIELRYRFGADAGAK
ncbi:MAG: TonB-dependent receptor [Proteobacteria bacterium]|nr:TonB-dependent receptor [Pseudomonadota bacterium]